MRVGLIVSNSLRDGPCKNFCRFPFGTRVERVPNVRGETIAAGRRWVAVLSSALPNNHRLNEAWRAQASLASGDAAGEPARAHADTRSVEGFDASLGGKPRERRRGRGTGACTGKPRADTHTHARAHTRTRMHPLACTQQVLRIELDDLQQFDGASWSVLRKMLNARSDSEMTINNNRSVGWQACAQMREARISPAAAVVFDVPSDEDTVAGICTPL